MAWTDPNTAVAGQPFTAAEYNLYVRDNLNYLRVQRAFKTADESVTSSTALQSDDDLFLAVAANEEWFCDFTLFVEGSTSGDIKLALNIPTSATGVWGVHGLESTDVANPGSIDVAASVTLSDASTIALFTAATPTLVILRATVFVAGTAGTIQLRWAQNGSNPTPTTIRAGSNVIGHRLST